MAAIMNCEVHKKKLELFCKNHDTPICVVCVSLHHGNCSDVVPLEEVSKNAKISTALTEIEETIDGTLKNIERFIDDRKSASESIEQKEQLIRSEIEMIRNQINKHLNELEDKLLLELSTKYHNCQAQNEKILKRLKVKMEELKILKDNTSKMKSNAHTRSDLQIFLGTREMDEAVAKSTTSVKMEIASAKNFIIDVDINSGIKEILKELNEFGNVKVEEENANLTFTDEKILQAQLHVPKTKTIYNTKLQLKQKYSIKQEGKFMWVCGCLMLENDHMLIADYEGNKILFEYNEKGEHIRDIPVSDTPFSLSKLDGDRIAVSYGTSKYIEILNIKNNIVERKLRLGNYCYGISYTDGNIYTVVYGQGIVVASVKGQTFTTIKCDVEHVYHLAAIRDRIYYTNWKEDTVYCCSMIGQVVWKFKDKSVIRPMGLSVDNFQNVFVVAGYSNNLTFIQHDGSNSRTILTEADGLGEPEVVLYEREKRILFICGHDSGYAVLYDII